METLLRYLPMLACPLIMGLMMWMLSRKDNAQIQATQPGEPASHPPLDTASPVRKVWNMLQCCLNWKVLAGLSVLGAGLWLVAPALFASALPVLLLLLCPLSMLLMMRGMNRSHSVATPEWPQLPGETIAGASSHE